MGKIASAVEVNVFNDMFISSYGASKNKLYVTIKKPECITI